MKLEELKYICSQIKTPDIPEKSFKKFILKASKETIQEIKDEVLKIPTIPIIQNDLVESRLDKLFWTGVGLIVFKESDKNELSVKFSRFIKYKTKNNGRKQ